MIDLKISKTLILALAWVIPNTVVAAGNTTFSTTAGKMTIHESGTVVSLELNNNDWNHFKSSGIRTKLSVFDY